MFGPIAYRAKFQNFRNPTNYILLDPEFYDNHYLQKNYALENNCNKDMTKIRLSSDKFF